MAQRLDRPRYQRNTSAILLAGLLAAFSSSRIALGEEGLGVCPDIVHRAAEDALPRVTTHGSMLSTLS